MERLLIGLAIGVMALIVIMLYRVWRGPTIYDRINGLVVIAADATILIVILGFISGRAEMFVDIAITYALLGFLTFIILAKYLEKRGKNNA